MNHNFSRDEVPNRMAGVGRILLHARPTGGDLRRRQGLLSGDLWIEIWINDRGSFSVVQWSKMIKWSWKWSHVSRITFARPTTAAPTWRPSTQSWSRATSPRWSPRPRPTTGSDWATGCRRDPGSGRTAPVFTTRTGQMVKYWSNTHDEGSSPVDLLC